MENRSASRDFLHVDTAEGITIAYFDALIVELGYKAMSAATRPSRISSRGIALDASRATVVCPLRVDALSRGYMRTFDQFRGPYGR